MNVEDVKEPEGSAPSSSEEVKTAETTPPSSGDSQKTEVPNSAVKKPKHKIHWLIWLLIILVVLGAAYLVYAQYGTEIANRLFGPPANSNSSSNTSSNSVSNNATTNTAASTVTKVTDEGVTWKTPVKLADLGLFTASPDNGDMMGGFTGATYYSVGTSATGADIIVAEVQAGIGGTEIHRFLKSSGKYSRLSKNSHELSTDAGYILGDVATDATFYFKSLSPDKSLVKSETELTYQFDGTITAVEGYDAGTKVDDTKWGDLKVEKGANAGDSAGAVKVSRYYIKLSDSTKAYYSVKPTFQRDDSTLDATFTDSSKKTIVFDQIKTSGCGNGVGSFPLVVKTAATAGKVQIASTAGSKIYSFTDPTNELIVFGYKVYNAGQDTLKPVAQFTSDLGLVLWTDAYGSTITYSNRDYAPLAECGKPVIYLYPKTDTQVSVKVGADVTKSDPEYGNGWTVLASPSGKLITDNGSLFDSLFWEGIGKGVYPEINSGVVVPASAAVNKIKSDLSTVGLNSKEIADFVDFWGPKLPTSGSVRLSWFFNDEMNKLAPLAVNPKPDSVIRVFLDFSAVDAGTVIPAQTLPTYARNGFTLVEWGGLLRK